MLEVQNMFLEMSEKRKNKEITFKEGEKIKNYVLDMIDRVPSAFFPRTYECYNEIQEFTGYLYDIRELKNLNIYGVIIGKALYSKHINLKEAIDLCKENS